MPVPPVGEISIEPLFPPLQEIAYPLNKGIVLSNSNSVGSVIWTVSVTSTLLLSVTLTV